MSYRAGRKLSCNRAAHPDTLRHKRVKALSDRAHDPRPANIEQHSLPQVSIAFRQRTLNLRARYSARASQSPRLTPRTSTKTFPPRCSRLLLVIASCTPTLCGIRERRHRQTLLAHSDQLEKKEGEEEGQDAADGLNICRPQALHGAN